MAREYGMVQDVTQPTMMKKVKQQSQMYLTTLLDDLLIAGDEQETESFIEFMEAKTWRVAKRGLLYTGAFNYLKRSKELTDNGVTIRADQGHIKEAAKGRVCI